MEKKHENELDANPKSKIIVTNAESRGNQGNQKKARQVYN